MSAVSLRFFQVTVLSWASEPLSTRNTSLLRGAHTCLCQHIAKLKQFYHPRNSGENTTNWKNCQASTKTLIFSFLFTTEIEVFLVFFCLNVHKLRSPNCRQRGIRLFVQFVQPPGPGASCKDSDLVPPGAIFFDCASQGIAPLEHNTVCVLHSL